MHCVLKKTKAGNVFETSMDSRRVLKRAKSKFDYCHLALKIFMKPPLTAADLVKRDQDKDRRLLLAITYPPAPLAEHGRFDALLEMTPASRRRLAREHASFAPSCIARLFLIRSP
jgi:hypothetical protein